MTGHILIERKTGVQLQIWNTEYTRDSLSKGIGDWDHQLELFIENKSKDRIVSRFGNAIWYDDLILIIIDYNQSSQAS